MMACAVVPVVRAQQSDSAMYARAQQMVNNGDAPAGRALLDSLLNTISSDSPRYAEALYWRARLAPTANDAERDFRRIVVDYSLSPRVDDALLRMGQLEFMRGARDAALQHFQRLETEHPDSPLRSRASYWTARVYFERNDLQHACAANADALARAGAADVELRNQIDFQNQRCRGVVVAQSKAPSPKSSGVVASATPAPVKTRRTPAASSAPSGDEPKPAVVPPSSDDAAPPGAVAPGEPVRAATGARSRAAAPSAVPGGEFSVQVAAFYDRAQAFALADKLRGRGYATHVDGSVAPFRVRIGHYKTHGEAAAMLAKLKAKKIDGFVAGG